MRFQMRQQVFENRLFDGFAFGRRLDDQIAGAKIGQFQRGLDPRHRGGLVFGADLAARHLPFDVAVDQRHGLVQAFLADVIHQHVISGQRKDMRNPIAHLPRAHDAH